MTLTASRKKEIQAMDMADQEKFFQDILLLSTTAEELEIISVLIEMVYEMDLIDPGQRRSLFERLAKWIVENHIGINDYTEFIQELEKRYK